MKDTKIERRDFIKRTVFSSLSVVVGVSYIATGCSNSEQKSNSKDLKAKGGDAQKTNVSECDDYSGVDQIDLTKREQFGYVKETANPENRCDNCQLWIPPKDDQKCGGCMLFKGPVYDEGYCTYWAPQV